MKKRCLTLFLALVLASVSLMGCTDKKTESSSSSHDSSSAASTSSVAEPSAGVTSDVSSEPSSESSAEISSEASSESSDSKQTFQQFADGDYKDVTAETAHAEITLSGSSAVLSDTTRGSSSEGVVTITSKGIYHVTGSGENISIVVNDDQESGNVYLILDNVTMDNTSAPCIDVEACDKLIIQCVGKNSLDFRNTDESVKKDGAIYAKDDVTINGSGTLNVTSALNGIVCKDDLRITDSTLTVRSDAIGIQVEKSVRVGGGTIAVYCNRDGVHLKGEDNDSFFYFEKANMTIVSGYDGISVKAGNDKKDFTGYVSLNGGILDITTASSAGASASKDRSISQKGIKTDGQISITDTELSVSAADDALHGESDIRILSGTLILASGDDGITASGNLTIDGGSVTVSQSYEALEATNVTINGGEIRLTSSDDGINCSGGSDTTSDDDNPWNSGSTDASLTINGGNIYVNATGDGLDSNGSIYVTGGTVIVEGPVANDNGALDKGDGNGCVASITGGTVLAIGSSGMAVNFDSGTQCSALVSLSGNEGTVISVNDGSGFTYTATKSFSSVVYSSPGMSQGNTYTIQAGSSSATMDFTDSLYYSEISGGPGGPGGFGGPGGPGGQGMLG